MSHYTGFFIQKIGGERFTSIIRLKKWELFALTIKEYITICYAYTQGNF
jgi:hypothetical protein